jgi:spermidine synthase
MNTTRRGITMLGFSAALNTLGNIAGVLLFGFVLLPWLGGLMAGKIVAASALVIAVVVAASVAAKRTRWVIGAALTGVLALIVMSPTRLDYEMLSSGANVYFMPQKWGAVIDHSESIDGGLTMVTRQVKDANVVTTLLTNGKFQGNDAKKGEVQAQIGFAALPLLHQERRENALVIGYGTGATSRVFHDAGFEHIDIAELSRDVVSLADSHFSGINGKVSTQKGVQTHITDGRNFLLLTRRQYDVISIEITSIWFAGAASLYNREFYHLARTKLRSDGVLQQWVQLHHMAPTDLLTIIGTLRAEFEYVSLYVVGGQGILIATNDAAHARPLPSAIALLDASSQLHPVRELAGRSFANIANDVMLSPSQVDVFLDRVGFGREFWISTDNNLKLEYNTPKSNANPLDTTFQTNLELLRSAQKWQVTKRD